MGAEHVRLELKMSSREQCGGVGTELALYFDFLPVGSPVHILPENMKKHQIELASKAPKRNIKRAPSSTILTIDIGILKKKRSNGSKIKLSMLTGAR